MAPNNTRDPDAKHSDARRSIERARQGRRLSGELRSSRRRPHLRVAGASEGPTERLPALTSQGANSSADFIWLEQPGDPRDGPVQVFETADSDTPSFVILQRADDATVREVRRADGGIELTVFRVSTWFRTRWTVNTTDAVDAYRIAERRRDALWRRTFGRLTKIDFAALEDLGLLFAPIVLPSLLMPPNRLEVTDRSGRRVGFVSIPSSALRPRESYCLSLDEEPLPLRDMRFALIAIAVVQDLK